MNPLYSPQQDLWTGLLPQQGKMMLQPLAYALPPNLLVQVLPRRQKQDPDDVLLMYWHLQRSSLHRQLLVARCFGSPRSHRRLWWTLLRGSRRLQGLLILGFQVHLDL